MNRRIVFLAVLYYAGMGCSMPNDTARFYEAEGFGSDYGRVPSRSLLFNTPPGAPPADWFAYRSDWPSAVRDISMGEIVTYDVYFVDRERADGGHRSNSSNTNRAHRVFRSLRSGRAYR